MTKKIFKNIFSKEKNKFKKVRDKILINVRLFFDGGGGEEIWRKKFDQSKINKLKIKDKIELKIRLKNIKKIINKTLTINKENKMKKIIIQKLNNVIKKEVLEKLNFKKSFSFLFVFLFIFSFAQNVLADDVIHGWTKQMGGVGSSTYGKSVVVDSNDNIYTTGYFSGTADFDPGTGVANLTSAGVDDIFISKLDLSGNFVWVKQFGGTGTDQSLSIKVDTNGNVYTTGIFSGTADFDPGAGAANLTSVGVSDIFISKLDSSGNFVWVKQMGGANYDYGMSLSLDSFGNIYTTGYFSGTADFDPGTGVTNLTSAGVDDIFISKLDSSGNFVWVKQFGGTGADQSFSIKVDTAGYVYTTGRFSGIVDFDPNTGVEYLNASTANRGLFVSKLNSSGEYIWAKYMGGVSSTSTGFSIDVDNTGNVYTAGGFQNTVDFNPGEGIANLTADYNNPYIFISKLNSNGEYVWAKKIGNSSTGTGSAYSITADSSGNVYITGYHYSTVDFNPGTGTAYLSASASRNAFIGKYDSNGEYIWANNIVEPSTNEGYSIALDSSGNVYGVGYFSGTADFDPGAGVVSLISFGGSDVYINKFSPIPSDFIPNQFVFIDQTLNASNTFIESSGITVSGINEVLPISITSCTSILCEYSINNGTYTTVAGTVINNDTVKVRQKSSTSNLTTTDLVLNIGGVVDTFSITTDDFTKPTISSFTIPSRYTSYVVPITTFIATDDVGVVGYLIKESSTTPLVGDSIWTASAPLSYTFNADGNKTLYVWVKDTSDKISNSVNASVLVDTIPIINSFTIPSSSNSLTVPVTLNATDNGNITGYKLTENPNPPLYSDSGWTETVPNSYTFSTASSVNSEIWAERTSVGSRKWYSVTSSSDGTKIAAVVYGGYIYTSIDSGLTWIERTNGGSRNWSAISSSSDGTKLVAAVQGGYIYTSTDSGVTWIARTNSGSRYWYTVASSYDGTKLVAGIASNGQGYVYTSTDSGVTWTARTNSGSRFWRSIASSSDGTKIVAAAFGDYIYTSIDSGVTWTARTNSGSRNWNAVSSSSDGTKLVAGAGYNNNGYLYTSADSGLTWTAQTNSGLRYWSSVASSLDGTKLVAAAGSPGIGYIYISIDSGITWIEQTSSGNRKWYSVTSSSDGTRLVGVVENGYIYNSEYGNRLHAWVKDDENKISISDLFSLDSVLITFVDPVLSTETATSVTETTATLNSSISNTGGIDPTVRGFQYGLTTGYGTTTIENGSFGIGAFSANISSLVPNSTYHYRSYATNSVGTAYGDDMTFSTDFTSPTVALTYTKNPIGVGTQRITATYSEPISSAPSISINQAGTIDIPDTLMTGSGSIWTFDYTVSQADGSDYLDGTATVSLSATTDLAGNTSEAPTNNTFTIYTNPPTGSITFEAGTAGETNSGTVTIPMPTVPDELTVEYKIRDDETTQTNPQDTGWVTMTESTTIPWTFDSDIEIKTLKYQFRDSAGNLSVEQTITTPTPISASSFIVQDTSNLSLSTYEMYIKWDSVASENFDKYILEYATSTDNATYTNYQTISDASFSIVGTNYFVLKNLDSTKFYRFRMSVLGTNGNTSVRTATLTARPDGVQNYGEGGGGSVATSSKIENVVVTQNLDKTVNVDYKITDSSIAKKVNPSYEAYLFYNIGITLPADAFRDDTLTLSDASKLKSEGYIQVNNEVIKYTSKNGNVLSGLTRGTWPTTSSSGRTTRQNTIFFAGTPVWIMATTTVPIAIADTNIAIGQDETIVWNTYDEVNLAGYSYPNTGIKVLVHDNQDALSGPLSSQNDFSENGIINNLDLTPPVASFTEARMGIDYENTTPAIVTLSIDRAYPLDTTIDYTLSGTADNSDYTLENGTFSIRAGQTSSTIEIPITDDTLKETDESIILTISNPVNAILGENTTFTYTIQDNDSLPFIEFTEIVLSGLENITSVNVPLTLSEIAGADTTIDYTLSGTADASDYTLVNGTATILAGYTTGNITIPIINDTKKEEEKTIIITLSDPVNAILGGANVFTYTLTDDDNLPIVQFTDASSSGSENISSVSIPVSIASIYPEDITITYTATGGTAEGNDVDYTLDQGTITIPVGETIANINLNIVNDDISEETETIEITLSDPVNGVLGTNNVYTYSILDNEIAITEITGSAIKSTSAIITWDTADFATSIVYYGTNAPGTEGAYNLTKTNLEKVLNHRIYLNNLTPLTTYYFKTESTNLSDETTTSESSFTTTAGPVLSLVTSTNITDTSSTITWTTDIASTSTVTYSTKPDLSDAIIFGNDELVTTHSVVLSNLIASSTYYFKVESRDAITDGNVGEETNDEAYYTFQTLSDMTPPVITNIDTPIITSSSMAIVWRTNEPATGQVSYGTETGVYTNNTTLSDTLVLNHLATVFELTKDTNYYYVVKSKDENGNESTSEEKTAKTTIADQVIVSGGGGSSGVLQSIYDALLAENEANKAKLKNQSTEIPVISDVTVSKVTAFGATINFTTNVETISFVDYGKDKIYDLIATNKNWSKTHEIKLTSLNIGTDYYFKVSAMDRSNNTATSPEQAFKTKFFSENLAELSKIENIEQFQNEIESTIESILPSLVPPFINKPEISDITENSALVTFKTNIKAYPIINYASDAYYDLTKANPYNGEISDTTGKNLTHTLQIIGLKPNTKYHVMAKAFSLPQVVGKGEDITFTTQTSKIKASVIDRKNDSFTVVWTTDEATSSIVEYKNTKTGRTDKMTDEAKNTSHSVKVENLIPGTAYQVKVSGINSIGNIVEGAETLNVNTSTDVIPPTISNFKVDSALVLGRTDKTQTIVSWQTDEPATSIVYYEEGSGAPDKALANKKEDTELTVNHVAILTTLKPGTVYRFQVASIDNASNLTKLPIRTIITPRPNESIVDVIFKNFDETFNFIKNVGN